MVQIIFPEDYTYKKMQQDILKLNNAYPFIKIYYIGKSVLGKTLPLIKLGTGLKKIICVGSHHAREWITTPLLMKFIEAFCTNLINTKLLYDYNCSDIYSNCTFYIIPMLNPDGVNLVINGLSNDTPFYSELLEMNKNNFNFCSWKANIKGVDLNRNYNAGWKEYKTLELSLGIEVPNSAGYSGSYPESEPETQAMVQITQLVNPELVLAFHAYGEEIYWEYNNITPSNSFNIVKELSKASGYAPIKAVELNSSYAGYKDWFIKEFHKPGFTIEVGKDKTPVPLSQFDEITEKNIKLILKSALLITNI